MTTAAGGRARVVDGALILAGVAALFAVPHRIGGDGEARFETLQRLFAEGRLVSPRYSVVAPLLAAPLYAAGRALGDPRSVTALLNPILFAAALGVFWRELRSDLSPPARRQAVLLLVFASMFPNHVQAFYGEVFTACAISLGILWLSRGARVRGWTAIVLGAVNTPATVIGVAAIAVREARRTRRWTPLAAPLAVLAAASLEALLVRGSLSSTGYEGDAGFRTALPYAGRPGFSYPLLLGLLSLLLSFGKGLAFFAPGLFAPVARGTGERLRWVHGTLVWFVAGLVVVYARWWAWYGGSFWGPRFFLVASMPACLALATHLGEAPRTPAMRALLAGALLLSFWVGANGLVFDQTGLGICSEDHFALEAFCLYVPEMSVLWHPFVAWPDLIPEWTRPLAVGVCLFWAAAACWTGRTLFADLGATLVRAARLAARSR